MNFMQSTSGVCLLVLSVFLAGYALENRELAQRVYAKEQEISALQLAQWGPQLHHSVRITQFDWGTPVVDDLGHQGEFQAVWFPLYPKMPECDQTYSDIDDPEPPKLLLVSTQPKITEQVHAMLDQATCTGVVLNGLPLWKRELSPAVRARWPGIDPEKVLVISDEHSRLPASIVIAGIMGFACAIAGAVSISGTFVPPSPTESQPRKRLPLLAIPANVKTPPPSAENMSRAYFHPLCQTATKVSGENLIPLESAFQPLAETFCCGCERAVSIDQLYWCDTGENVLEYRLRVCEAATPLQKLYLRYIASTYAGALNLGLSRSGEQIGEVGAFTIPPELSAAEGISASDAQGDSLVHQPRNLYFGPLTVNEYGLEIATNDGKVSGLWDDVQSAELSQGELVIELTTSAGNQSYRIPGESIPNPERVLQFLAEVAPAGAVIV